MKILHFIYDHIENPWVGGGGSFRCYNIYNILSKKYFDITVISGKFKGIQDYEENKNFRFKFIGKESSYILSIFSYAYYANKFLRENYKKFDVIIEDFAPWNPIFSYKFQDKIPVVLQIHHKEGLNILKKYSFLGIPFLYIEKFYPIKFFNNIISVSSITAKKFNIEKFEIISNGIDLDLLKIPISIGNYILYIGRIDIYNKGIDLLLKVNKNYNIIIAGKGKDEHKLKEIITNSNIKIIGFVSKDKKKEVFKNAKFLVMPSRFEGQGIIALEAAAAGKPVVVSDIPELNYVVKNGFGISFRCGDYIDLEKKIEFLLNNEKLIIEMGKKGKNYAKNFTWEKIAQRFEKYILNIIQRGGRNGSNN